MRAVIQKVSHAQVDVLSEGHRETSGKINHGFLILLGITHDDNETDASYIADKIANLRIFEDEAGKLNLSLKDTGGSVLLVSQFTLYADARSGRPPLFFRSRPCPAGRIPVSTHRRIIARPRSDGRNRPLSNPYAGFTLQRRSRHLVAGFQKTVLKQTRSTAC